MHALLLCECVTQSMLVQSVTLQQQVDDLARQGAVEHLQHTHTPAGQQLRHVRQQVGRGRKRLHFELPAPRAPPVQHQMYAPRPKLAGFSPNAVLVSPLLGICRHEHLRSTHHKKP